MATTAESSFVTGTVKYLAASAESSLHANGKVLTFRDPDGNSDGSRGVDLQPHAIRVHDARACAARDARTLKHNGFELLHSPVVSRGHDFLDHRWVVEHYYDECAALVEQATGAWGYTLSITTYARPPARTPRPELPVASTYKVRRRWYMAITP